MKKTARASNGNNSPLERIPYFPQLLLMAAGFLVYLNSFGAPFIFDDIHMIVKNPDIKSWAAISDMFDRARFVYYGTFALNYALGGLHVFGYHLVNVIIHILSALILYGIVKQTLTLPIFEDRFQHESRELSFAISLLWLIHPLQTASVTYISQRAESLMGLFYLFVLYCSTRGFQSKRPLGWYAASILSAILGMATKQAIVSVPAVVFLYDCVFISKSFHQVLKRRFFFYTMLTLAVSVTPVGFFGSYGTSGSAGFSYKAMTWAEYAMTQPAVILHYIKLVFWPSPLCLDYVWPIVTNFREVIVPGSILLLLIGSVLWLLLYHPRAGFLGASFFIMLGPTSSIVPIADAAFEHRMYLPLASIVAGAVLGIDELFHRLSQRSAQGKFDEGTILLIRKGFFLFVVLALSCLTLFRNYDYRSDLSIWEDTVKKRPENPRAHNNLGYALFARGDFDGARQHFEEAVKLFPMADAYLNLGFLSAQTGDAEKAVAFYGQALKINPQMHDANFNLGNLFLREGGKDEAKRYYEKELKINPNHFNSHNNLGNLLLADGQIEEAVDHYNKAIRLSPDYLPARNNLGIALTRLGRKEEAIREYREALERFPNSPDLHNSLGAALLEQGRTAEAVEHFRSAVKLRPDFADAASNLRSVEGPEKKSSSG